MPANGPPEGFRRILFVELLGGLGDALISLGAIQALARSNPKARLTVLTFPPGGELLEEDELVREVAYAEPGRAREAVEEQLDRGGWDLVVSDTSYDGIGALIRASGVPRVAANLWRSPPPDERVGERFLRLLVSDGLISNGSVASPMLSLSPGERAADDACLSGLERPLVFLLPDAGMEAKRWPEGSWMALGRALREQCGADIVVPVGSDEGQAGRVAEGAGGAVLPRGTLRELAAALSHADLAIGADTGPARIAAALRVPTVTLFGPSWHGRYGQPPPHANLQGHPACPQRNVSDFTRQPCWYAGVCTLDGRSWRTCLEDVPVESVLETALVLLRKDRSAIRGEAGL